jgi:hypothetical protein
MELKTYITTARVDETFRRHMITESTIEEGILELMAVDDATISSTEILTSTKRVLAQANHATLMGMMIAMISTGIRWGWYMHEDAMAHTATDTLPEAEIEALQKEIRNVQ